MKDKKYGMFEKNPFANSILDLREIFIFSFVSQKLHVIWLNKIFYSAVHHIAVTQQLLILKFSLTKLTVIAKNVISTREFVVQQILSYLYLYLHQKTSIAENWEKAACWCECISDLLFSHKQT